MNDCRQTTAADLDLELCVEVDLDKHLRVKKHRLRDGHKSRHRTGTRAGFVSVSGHKIKAGTETMVTPGSKPILKRAVAMDENSNHTGTTQIGSHI